MSTLIIGSTFASIDWYHRIFKSISINCVLNPLLRYEINCGVQLTLFDYKAFENDDLYD